MQKVNILGTVYTIETRGWEEDEILKERNAGGYCVCNCNKIIIADLNKEPFSFENEKSKEQLKKQFLRHEILHAFLEQSGLNQNSFEPSCGWAVNEEMVDWFALQSPKIFKAYKELDLI